MIAKPKDLKVFFGPNVPFAWTASESAIATIAVRCRNSGKVKLTNYEGVVDNIGKGVVRMIMLAPHNEDVIRVHAAKWKKEGALMPFQIYLSIHGCYVTAIPLSITSIFRVNGDIHYFNFDTQGRRRKRLITRNRTKTK